MDVPVMMAPSVDAPVMVVLVDVGVHAVVAVVPWLEQQLPARPIVT